MVSSEPKTRFLKAIDEKVVAAHRYISDFWPELTRTDDPDDEERIPLPHPYAMPSTDRFPYLFYWDSYFTLVGLAVDGHRELMRWMVDNFLHEMREFGLILNYSHTNSLTRTQPPYLTLMIKEILKHDLDHDWLREAFALAEAEYEEVWVGNHNTPVGLSRYCDQGAPDSEKRAQYESGWDFSSRWKRRCRHLAAIDLNCNLYQYERDLAEFAWLLGDHGEESRWLAKAAERRERIIRYLYDPLQGLFFDYDYLAGHRLDDRHSLATFHPLFVGLVTSQEAARVVGKLGLFERAGGLATTSRQHRAKGPYQWDYPNGWAPLHWITLSGLKRYGYFEEAARLAVKWLTLGAEMFAQTGKMWEKYNVAERDLAVTTVYPNQHGFGWTNGVYSALLGKVIGGLDFDPARQAVILEPLLCPAFAGQEFAAHFRRYLVGDLALRFSSGPDLRRVEIGVAAEQAIPAIEVRVRDYFPTEMPVVTLNGVPRDYRRERKPYETVVVEVNDVEDVTLNVAWDGVQKPGF
jgi:alpha,alpha-trehalase